MSSPTGPSTTISIRLPADTAQRLRDRASLENTTLNGLVSRLITEHLAQPAEGQTAYDVLKPYIGCCASDDGADARNAKKEWGEYVEEKHARRYR